VTGTARAGAATIAALFPDGVVSVVASEAMWREPGAAAEEACIARAVAKRQREFRAGRACARRALAALGVRDFALRAGPDRAPIWPEGILGSISHCDDYCAAVATRRGPLRGLGLDVEPAEPLPEELREAVCSPSERDHLRSLPPAPAGDWPRLLFSAKESTYKCYYPLAGAILDFPDLELRFDVPARRFVARLVSDSAPSAQGARRFEGRFDCTDRHLFTAVALRAEGAPGDVG